MPTAELPQRSSGVDLAGITSLANLFLPKNSSTSNSGTTQNSGGTTTQGTQTVSNNVSQDAVDAVVKSILQGTNGLAAVSSGQNRAGLYGSTTNQMLVNDLIARTAAEGAKLNSSQTTSINNATADNRATTTNNTATTQQQAQISPKTAVTGLGALQVLGMLGKSGTGQKLLSSLGLGAGKVAGGGANTPGEAVPPNPDAVTKATDTSNSTAPTTANVGGTAATSNTQDVASSVQSVMPTSNTVDLSGIQSNTPMDYGQGGDLSFDQTADNFTSDAINGLDLGSAGSDVAGGIADGIDSSAGDVASSAGDWGPDPSTIDFGSGPSMDDLFDFAVGGLVTPQGNANLLAKQSNSKNVQRKGYAGGGYVNVQAEKAFSSGGDENSSNSNSATPTDTSSQSSSNFDFFRQKVAAPASAPQSTEYTPHKGVGVRLIEAIKAKAAAIGYAKGGYVSKDEAETKNAISTPPRRGYATGGLVTPDLTNTGLRVTDVPDNATIAPTISADQLVNYSLKNKTPADQSGGQGSIVGKTATGGTTATNNAAGNSNIRPRSPINSEIAGSSGVGEGMTDGPVGTPGQNQGALDSAIGLGLGSVVGGPIGGLVGMAVTSGLNGMTGATPVSMSPFSQLVNVINGLVSPDPMADAAATASAANTSPSQSDNDAAVANGIAADTGLDPLDALVGIVSDPSVGDTGNSGNDGTSGEGGGVGGSGNSAGDGNAGDGGNGSGDGGDGGGGTASAANGGLIKGPGTKSSDSIPANLSDGEYVIHANAVNYWGKDFFDMLNSAIAPASRTGG